MMRLVGAREIASGFGILAQSKPTPWLWSRVGGDAMDLALLKSAMDSPRSDRNRVATATMAVLGITAADLLASTRMTAEPTAPYEAMHPRRVHATTAATVQAPNGVFGYWDGFQSLPRFMSDAATVQITGDRQSRGASPPQPASPWSGMPRSPTAAPTRRSPGAPRTGRASRRRA